MERPDFEKLEVYRVAEKLANETWQVVGKWNEFDKDTLGKPIVIAADSIGANIAKGKAHNYKDNRYYVRIAKDFLNETRHGLRQAYKRQILTMEEVSKLKQIIDKLSVKLNAYLGYLDNAVKEHPGNDD